MERSFSYGMSLLTVFGQPSRRQQQGGGEYSCRMPTSEYESDESETHPLIIESIRISNRGESRANLLDSIGWVFLVLGVLVGVGAAVVLATQSDDTVGAERVQAVLLLAGIMFGYLIVIAVFFGFAALVRNTSRMLSLQAIDSGLNDESD